MNWKATVAALLTVAVMAAAWYFLEVKGGEKRRLAEEASAKVFVGLDTSRLEALVLQAEAQPQVRLRKSGPHWNLESPLVWPADEALVGSLCQQLKDLTREETVLENAAAGELKEFGLDAAGEWLSFSGLSGTAGTLWFGSKNPQGSQCYARVSGSAAVILVNAYSKTALLKKADELRERRVWTLDPAKVTLVHSTFTEAPFTLEKQKDGAWRLKGVAEPLSADKVSTFLTQLGGLRVKDFVSEDGKDAARYGLSRPAGRLEIQQAGEAPLVLLKGKPDPKGTTFFARVEGRPLVFSLENSSVAGNLATTRDSLIVPKTPTPVPATPASLTTTTH